MQITILGVPTIVATVYFIKNRDKTDWQQAILGLLNSLTKLSLQVAIWWSCCEKLISYMNYTRQMYRTYHFNTYFLYIHYNICNGLKIWYRQKVMTIVALYQRRKFSGSPNGISICQEVKESRKCTKLQLVHYIISQLILSWSFLSENSTLNFKNSIFSLAKKKSVTSRLKLMS